MAPITNFLLEKRRLRSYSNSSSSGFSGGGISGTVIAGIIALVVLIFLIVLWSEYSKAKKIQARNGTPIPTGKILKKATLVAISLGLVSCICADACGIGDNDGGAVSGGGGGGGQTQAAPQMGVVSGGGFVQQPQPTWQPQMDYTPIQGAAVDGVQG